MPISFRFPERDVDIWSPDVVNSPYTRRQFQTYSQGWAEVHDKIPMVVARAFRATSLRLKWQLMRYLPIEKDIWQSLSQLWSFVEDKGIEHARVVDLLGERRLMAS